MPASLRTPMAIAPFRRGRGWESKSTKTRWREAWRKAIAGARRCGVMPTAHLRSGEMTDNPTRYRFRVMLMIFVCVVITFLDRSNISITAPALRKELGIDTVHMGWILSAFGWTY